MNERSSLFKKYLKALKFSVTYDVKARENITKTEFKRLSTTCQYTGQTTMQGPAGVISIGYIL